MRVERTPAFRRDLRRAADPDTLRRVEDKVAELEAASSLFDVANVRRLSGAGRHYRVRIGNHRLGVTLEGETVVLRRLLHRSDFYRYFP